MKKFCPHCLKLKKINEIYVDKIYIVDGIEIEILAKYNKCSSCKNIFPSLEFQDENFSRVYNKYEKKTGKKPERVGFIE